MTEKDLFREIGMINEKYVEEAAEVKRAKILTPTFRRTLATAACLCICVGVYFGTRGLRGDFAKNESAADMSATQDNMTSQAGATSEGAYFESADMEATTDSDGGIFEDFFNDFASKEESTASNTENMMQDATDTDNYMDGASAEQVPQEEQEVGEGALAKKELEEYSNAYEELCNEEAFVVTHGKITAGYDKWELFLNGYERGEAVSVDVIRFTVEGDAIITRVWYESGAFHIIEDSTRDAWGNGTYTEYAFEAINIIKSSDGMVQVIFADSPIQDPASVNPEETPMYFLVEYKITD